MSTSTNYIKIAKLRTVDDFRSRLKELGLELPVDSLVLTAVDQSPLAAELEIGDLKVGNRWCIHPMEGWDANPDGSPSQHTLRRWHHFGKSGAKLIWGGEAAAVQREGRANPRQTLAVVGNQSGLAALLRETETAHRAQTGTLDGLVVGLQLTHSGRFSKPGPQPQPMIAYHHPLLDAKFGIDPHDASVILSDARIELLIDEYVAAAHIAASVGFQFVDIKACHGYLLHEFLSARVRPGKFGGDLEGRSRLLLDIVRRVRTEVPELGIGVRLSVFDSVPYVTSREVGRPMDHAALLPYEYGFGVDANDPLHYDLAEPIQLMRWLAEAGVSLFNVTCGSPYYVPHIQRPAIFPPSDGYQPPEDPLVGVVRQIDVVRQCKVALPNLCMVGSGYTYLQDYLPHVAQAVVRAGWVDVVGLGRMVLSYPELPWDSLTGNKLQRKKICRTFSDCTTAPRHGLVSGCYPLDEYYKQLDEYESLKAARN